MWHSNISFLDFLKVYVCRISVALDLLRAVTKFRRKFKNYFHVIYEYKRKTYPIHAVRQDGRSIRIENRNEVIAILNDLRYVSDDDIVLIKYGDNNFRIRSGIDNGELVNIFHNNLYSFLPAHNNLVVDIGANIGDSAIYFVARGAKKVIALEACPQNYELAKINIASNGISSKVELVPMGCSKEAGLKMIDNTCKGASVSTIGEITDPSRAQPVEFITLQGIVEKYQIDSASLKVDCEGCEYDSILTSSASTLRAFTHIQIEYHYGYKNIKKKLERSGFKVKRTLPHYHYNAHATNPVMYVGWVYGERLDF